MQVLGEGAKHRPLKLMFLSYFHFFAGFKKERETNIKLILSSISEHFKNLVGYVNNVDWTIFST